MTKQEEGVVKFLNLSPGEFRWLSDLVIREANPPTEAMIKAAMRRRELFGEEGEHDKSDKCLSEGS